MTIEDVIQSAKDGNREVLKRLLADDPALAGARAASGETPLMAALYRGHQACVDLIIETGTTLDIFAAAAVGKMDALDAAITSDSSAVNSYAYDGWTALHLAAFFGHRPAAERLLAAGADLGAVSRNALRNTPLHAAIAGGRVDVSLMFIERGASLAAADAGGHTPLHIAAEGGYLPIARALLERGADPHAVDAEDQTPLSRATARRHSAIIDLINERE
jgi:ankyrin repeat protein